MQADPGLAAIVLVYGVQGGLGLSRLATSYFLKDELALDPAAIALLTSAAAAPWLVKPLWGALSDAVPLLGYRRRSYLALSGLVGAAGWAALATAVHSREAALAALLATSLSTAVADVVVDGLVVERARHGEGDGGALAEAGSLQSLCWGASAVGGIASAYFSGSLVQALGPRPVMGLTAVLPLLVCAVAPLVADTPAALPSVGGAAAALAAEASALASVLRRRSVWAPAAFVFLWQAAPNCDTAWFFFVTEKLNFQPEFLGQVRPRLPRGCLRVAPPPCGSQRAACRCALLAASRPS